MIAGERASRPAGSDYASGSGSFGTWTTDEFGLPAYRYELDQFADPRGTWDTRLNGRWDTRFRWDESRDPDPESPASKLVALGGERDSNESTLHWHQLGNDRLIAVTTNEGWTQLYSHEYGPRWINHYRPARSAFAGGASFVGAGSGLYSSLYAHRPDEASVERIWGCSYSRYRLTTAELELVRTLFAPFGDSPFLVALVRVRNLTQAPLDITHLEYWDLNIHSLDATGPDAWQFDTQRRDSLSKALYAEYSCTWDEQTQALTARHPWREIIGAAQDWPGAMQRNRPDVCLVPLGVDCDSFVTERAALFPTGDLHAPGPLTRAAPVEDPERSPTPVLAALSTHRIEVGGEVVLGFAYGATPADETPGEIARIREIGAEGAYRSSMHAWRAFVPDVELADEDLSRELAWSSYYLRSGVVYDRRFQAHTIPQGGAYQYLAGENAGPRATLQHALPLIWLAPDLTRDALRFTFAETHPSGEIPYAENANGAIDTMRYIPSDHALWLLWAVSDYVLAMRDRPFLGEICSYWPPPYTRPEPVWDHCLRAWRHLIDDVGFGPHGLLRMRTSDWNDAVIREGGVPIDRVWAEGESTLNSAMAVFVLRRFAELATFAGHPELAAEAGSVAADLAEAVRACWRGRHLNRGWRAADSEVGATDLYLEPQPWALIADILDPDQARTLVEEMGARLADPNGTRIFAAGDEGNPPTAGGGQWLSINSTLVWGLTKVDVDRAWDELKANTLHNHATVYPDVWFGIWSGPDTYLPASSRYAGETWSWPGVFGMQAWPIQILFAHSETLNGLIWALGIEASAAGLSISPRIPHKEWAWRSNSLSIDFGEAEIAVAYRGIGPEHLPLEIALPERWHGRPISIESSGGIEQVVAGTTARVVLAVADRLEARCKLTLETGAQAERGAA